jgi:glycosyltransferase involved in cell wall biosynthesis
MYFSLFHCLQKYGASNYLKILRMRFQAGLYTKEHFAYLAANVYFFLNKPIRALTLLKSVDFAVGSPYRQRMLLVMLSSKNPFIKSSTGCSLNMIVKNESAAIGGALDSIDDCMDEIIICDTGSIDTTREIAALYGANILSVPWRDDFSAARNEAIKASTFAWIFWMDADDRLKRESRGELERIWQFGRPQAAAICVTNMQNHAAGAEFMQVRLFPRQDGLVFERRIHEQIMFNAKRLNIPFTQYPTIKIMHIGYNDPGMHKKKAERNISLIALELKDHQEDPALLSNYGDCQMSLSRFDEALGTFMCIAANRDIMKGHPDIFAQAIFNIGCLYHKKRDRRKAKQWFIACIRADWTRIEAYFLLGRIFEQENDPIKAFDCYLQASQIIPPIRQTATNSLRIRIESIYKLAIIMARAGRLAEAERLLSQAIEAYPHVVEYHSLIGRIMLEQEKLKEAARSFMQSLSLSARNNREACTGMAAIYSKLNNPDKAKRFLAMAESQG